MCVRHICFWTQGPCTLMDRQTDWHTDTREKTRRVMLARVKSLCLLSNAYTLAITGTQPLWVSRALRVNQPLSAFRTSGCDKKTGSDRELSRLGVRWEKKRKHSDGWEASGIMGYHEMKAREKLFTGPKRIDVEGPSELGLPFMCLHGTPRERAQNSLVCQRNCCLNLKRWIL